MQLAILIPAAIVGSITSAAASSIPGASGLLALSTTLDTTLGHIVNLIWNSIWTAFYAIVIVVTYHDLRVAKEGVDTEQIAAVFE